MSTALPVNLTAEQGTDFVYIHTVKAINGSFVDLTDYSVAGVFARNYTTTTKYNLNAEIPVETITEGVIKLSLDQEITAGLKSGRYLYNVFLTNPSGEVDIELEGVLTIAPSVLNT